MSSVLDAGVAPRDVKVAENRGTYRLTLACAVVACALMPAYDVRWHVGFYPTTLLEVALLVTVATFTVETVLGRIPVIWPHPLTLPIALLLVAGAVSVVVSPDHRAALGLYRAYFLEPAAFFVVLAHVVITTRRAALVLFGLGVALIVLAIPNIAVTLKAMQDHTLNVGGTPPVAIYNVSNAVALFEVPVVAVAASLVVYARSRLERLISAVVTVVGTVSVLLTFSRGGYLALLAVGLFLAATHPKRLWFLAGIVLISLLAARIPAVATRLGHELNLSDPSNSIRPRFELWQVTLRMLASRPVFGSGLAGFAHAIEPYRGRYAEQQIYPHNIVLNFWAELGLPGLVAFGWLVIRTAQLTWRGWREGPPQWRPYQLGILLFLVSVVAHGLVDVPFFKNDLSVQFWTLLAISWAGFHWGRSQPADGTRG